MDARPKISKHLSSRLPDVFMPGRTSGLREKKGGNQHKAQPEKNKVETKDNAPGEKNKPKVKKSRNPFLPMQQWMKISKQFENRINEVINESDRFSKLNLNANNQPASQPEQITKQHRLKYEDFLTLNILKKGQAGGLKKIIHVPSLKVYFLRQSLIDMSIDKNDLQQWIKKCNEEAEKSPYKVKPQKIVNLFWNIPENFYSIIYQYVEGNLFETTLQNVNTFPTSFIQNLALSHLRASFQIYNSQLIIKKNKNADIAYLPIYEQADDMIPQQRNFRELMKMDSIQGNQSSIDSMQRKMSARLGFLILLCYFGDTLSDEDIGNVLFSTSNQCCLLHKLINQNSLIGIYIEQNMKGISGKQKQTDYLIDFLCRSLKFQPNNRTGLGQLRKHKFLRSQLPAGACQIWQIMNCLEYAGTNSQSSRSNPSRQLSMHKLNKIIDSMTLILQGNNQKFQVNFSADNENIRYLIRELGLGNSETQFKLAFSELSRRLKKVYSQ